MKNRWIRCVCAWALIPLIAIGQATDPAPAGDGIEQRLPKSLKKQRQLGDKRASASAEIEILQSALEESLSLPGAITDIEQRVEKILARAPRNAPALLLSARIAMLQARPAIAVMRYRSAVAMEPSNAAAQLGLAQALEATGDVAGADAAYSEYRKHMHMHVLPTPAGNQESGTTR